MGEFHKVNYISNKRYLYMCYGDTMQIFDIENNMQMVTIKNDVYEYDNSLERDKE